MKMWKRENYINLPYRNPDPKLNIHDLLAEDDDYKSYPKIQMESANISMKII